MRGRERKRKRERGRAYKGKSVAEVKRDILRAL
jgi:hypothetical protein